MGYLNNYKKYISLAFFSTTILLFGNEAFANNEQESIVIYTEEPEQTLEILQLKYDITKIDSIEEAGIIVVNGIDADDIREEDKIEKLLNLDSKDVIQDVKLEAPKLVQPEHILELESPAISNPQWNIEQVTNNYESYKVNTGSHITKVGIIDTGVDLEHPDLQANLISKGKSLVPNMVSTDDKMGHGTMVAGIIAANGNLSGIAPNIGIVPYKVYDDVGSYSTWVIEAIIEATKDDMDVINLSLNTFKSKKNPEDKEIIKAFEKAFKFAESNNTTIVVSAGNEGVDISKESQLADQLNSEYDRLLILPAASKNTITVGALTKKGIYAPYSNYGKYLNLVAPGGSYELNESMTALDYSSLILTTYPTDLENNIFSKMAGIEKGYELNVGTSLSAAHVTATIALIKDQYKKLNLSEPSNKMIEKILYQTVDRTSYPTNLYGKGSVNAYKALQGIK
ncbi:S8 family peptidase [Ureibacillus aquaedulcis]|uniref:S8 family serine peptidase n=1 Tax=Ureibacillus aquaedulcis TaxID=3058421 RepID=A0ABT8GVU2_9BACL|nr:S8 family serine peptidase [Ureibacillus sp. BA0131]MDN4495534.1 S8 family serine peptidase [Ureibacillus sp. BA0131]